MATVDQRLAATFSAQLGLVSRRQVMASGGTDEMIAHRLRTGRWELAERGVYAIVGMPWSWRRDLASVVLSTRGAVASHRAAAVVLGAIWDDRAEAPLEITVPGGRRSRRRFRHLAERSPQRYLVVHESLDLRRDRPVLVDGIPVTSPLRLLVDLGSVVPFDRFRRAASLLRRRYDLEWDDVHRIYRQHSIQGRNGCGALRELLDLHFGEASSPDEVIEIKCADLLRAAGLPAPVHQFEVIRADGRRARLDLAYPELRIGIETDGSIHGDDDVRQTDNRRRNNLLLLGWTILHFTWEDVVHRPEMVVATVRAAIDRATTASGI